MKTVFAGRVLWPGVRLTSAGGGHPRELLHLLAASLAVGVPFSGVRPTLMGGRTHRLSESQI